jgi:bifunctional non-homologous end joining protein LigD
MKECDAGVYDGEQIGDTVVLWDMLDHSGKNLTGLPYFQRLAHLQAAVDLPEDMYFAGAGDISSIDESNSVLRIVKTARTAAEKAALFKYLKDNDKEGTTFKDIHAPYESGGRSESAIKVKFWETLSAVVTMVNTKRSVGLQLFEDDGEVVYVGNVSIPVNQDIPNPGDVVEVRYLYAHKQGSLFEPTYLGPRSDIRASECLASQRKFKPDAKPASGMKIS